MRGQVALPVFLGVLFVIMVFVMFTPALSNMAGSITGPVTDLNIKSWLNVVPPIVFLLVVTTALGLWGMRSA